MCTFLVLIAVEGAYSQSGGQVISYDQLLKRKVQKKFTWLNPDSSREEIAFIQTRIPVDREMRDLTSRFMQDNYGRNSIWVEPRMIVIHSMDLEDLRTSLEKSSFLDKTMPEEWQTVIKAGHLPSGAHFIIDRDGTIYCLTPPSWTKDETKISYNRNQHQWLVRRHLDAVPMAIGIENVTARDGTFEDLTDKQIESNAQLVSWLLWMEKGTITHVTSHHQFNDTTRFESMLREYSLTLPRPMYRAWERQDVGDEMLVRILAEVRRRGWVVKEDF